MKTSRHHLFFPRSSYKSTHEQLFRSLPCAQITIDHEVHQLLHRYQPPPVMPPPQVIQATIERHRRHQCGCP